MSGKQGPLGGFRSLHLRDAPGAAGVGLHGCLNQGCPLPTVSHFSWGFAADAFAGQTLRETLHRFVSQANYGEMILLLKPSQLDDPQWVFLLITSGGLRSMQSNPEVS